MIGINIALTGFVALATVGAAEMWNGAPTLGRIALVVVVLSMWAFVVETWRWYVKNY